MNSTKFVERFDPNKMFLKYTLADGTTIKVPTMLDKLSIRENNTIFQVYAPKSVEIGKYIFDKDDDDYDVFGSKLYFDCQATRTFDENPLTCIYQLLLALDGDDTVITRIPTGSMQKEGIVSVAISFEK